jgi:endonuclease/exonuclease/phosphatase (EEP) superfamily protein YafD
MYTILYILSLIFILLSLIPFFPLKAWWTRFLESLRPLLVVLLTALCLLLLFLAPWNGFKIISLILIAATVYLLLREIIIYLPISRQEIMNSAEEKPHITVLVHNVLMSNDNIEALEQSVNTHQPDLLLLIEFTEEWQEMVGNLREKFEDYLEHPLDSGYGMALYAKEKLVEKQIRFLVKEDIPSIDVVTRLENGKEVRVFGIHPAPPAPQFDYDTQTKDQEALEVAKLIKKSNLPAIVAGDLNDINWSQHVKDFKTDCEVLDPRIGRGFFPTFHAKKWMINYPLDHIFASKHFELFNFEVVPLEGSDHHGVKAALVLKD